MFLYYLPGERTANSETIAKHGIGYAFEGSPTYREIFAGPDQSAGGPNAGPPLAGRERSPARPPGSASTPPTPSTPTAWPAPINARGSA